jgi:hypothetical protein
VPVCQSVRWHTDQIERENLKDSQETSETLHIYHYYKKDQCPQVLDDKSLNDYHEDNSSETVHTFDPLHAKEIECLLCA